MQVQRIENNNTTFGSKNTFLHKAKTSRFKIEEYYWKSLHYEAKSRLYYQRYNNAIKELQGIDDITSISSIKTFSKIALNKLKSVIFESKSYGKFPNRFAEADNLKATEERYYKLKMNI